MVAFEPCQVAAILRDSVAGKAVKGVMAKSVVMIMIEEMHEALVEIDHL